jgi:branched-chain amino acid transport system permease protein
MRLVAYLFTTTIAGCIVALSGWNTALTPTMGFLPIVMAFVAFLVGGVSDVRGTIVASYLIAAIPELVVGLSPGLSLNWRMTLVFLIAAIFLVVRPRGLFATATRSE